MLSSISVSSLSWYSFSSFSILDDFPCFVLQISVYQALSGSLTTSCFEIQVGTMYCKPCTLMLRGVLSWFLQHSQPKGRRILGWQQMSMVWRNRTQSHALPVLLTIDGSRVGSGLMGQKLVGIFKMLNIAEMCTPIQEQILSLQKQMCLYFLERFLCFFSHLFLCLHFRLFLGQTFFHSWVASPFFPCSWTKHNILICHGKCQSRCSNCMFICYIISA